MTVCEHRVLFLNQDLFVLNLLFFNRAGNDQGLGDVRRREFKDSCRVLSLPGTNVIIDPVFEDNPIAGWDVVDVASSIKFYTEKLCITDVSKSSFKFLS